jgi:7,8-dihydropterin-6-yl-methyl-4-(beta-D-ribofuranosyl)aminobenzene 5'-phosphate synthase
MKKLLALLAACFLAVAMVAPACATDTGKLTVSVLCDDKASSEKYLAEHGVSMLVELPNGHRWLFDTGSTDVFLQNAQRLGVSLDNLTGIAISHGHGDHTGGLIFYPRLKGKPPIYGHPYIWHKQYECRKGVPTKVVGMPDLAREYAYPAFKPVNNVTKLDENMYFFTDVPREPGSYCPTLDKFFNEDCTGACPINDDATLVIKLPQGLVAIFGCSHAGYRNILKAIEKEFPNEKFLAVLGGLHLKEGDEKVMADALAYTDKVKGKDFVFACAHCTGENAIEYFKKNYGEQVVKPAGAGTVVEFASGSPRVKGQ